MRDPVQRKNPRARVLIPEILDSLDPGDPEAVRSRADLRRLDRVLGGTGWIARAALRDPAVARAGFVELGAGEGILCNRLAEAFPGVPVTGLDLAPAPGGLRPGVSWVRGDFLRAPPDARAGVAVGSLILHHFSQPELLVLGASLRGFRALIFSEPWRSRLPLALSFLAAPFVGRVTRHDMPASIRAGFRRGELAPLLGLPPDEWKIKESLYLPGALRFHAWRD